MNIKLVLLRSGEDVVTVLSEMVVTNPDGKEITVGYTFKDPYTVKLLAGNNNPESEEDNVPFRLSLSPWMPLSKDDMIPVVSDHVVSITEPIDDLISVYKEGIEKRDQRRKEREIIEDSAASRGNDSSDSD